MSRWLPCVPTRKPADTSADALNQFSESDFEAAGCPDWVRGRLSHVASHENSHVTLLSGALGDAAVQPCTYKL